MRKVIAGIAFALAASLHSQALADEVTLYEGNGQPVAYIVTNDEMTIYTWEGHAVAYLVENDNRSWYVYGWNGKHLGWFERGVIWNTNGYAQCAIRQALAAAAYAEPAKYAKYAKFAKYARYAPYAKPTYSNTFDHVPCVAFLTMGDAGSL
jgi:hypothetical protein